MYSCIGVIQVLAASSTIVFTSATASLLKASGLSFSSLAYKARLVAKGYTQLYGVDYEETFSPVADIRAIRILIAIAAFYDYEIWQMDVKFKWLS
ncbi:retrotransposon protein, putative, ty1-copia subclass [Tanacetum coccineum]